MPEMDEIKSLIETQGKAFEAFKATLEEAKKHDALTDEKLSKIEKDLDAAVEAKSKIEAALTAERKEREDLELRLSRKGSASDDKSAIELKQLNTVLAAEAAKKGVSFAPLNAAEGDAYRKGFSTYLRKGEKVIGADESKAMSVGGDPDGGYFVTPDVGGRIVTKVFESSPIRQIADVMSIGSDKLEGMEDRDEADAGWVAEKGTRADTGTPQVGKWSIEAFEMYAQPKATQKLLDDASVDIESWLAGKLADKFARTEASAFVVGNGAGKPTGFTAYATAADSGSGVDWGKIGYVVSGKNGDFADANPADKLFDLVGLLRDQYLGNARFVTRRAVITKIRKFKDGQGQYLWAPGLAAGQPEQILSYPVTRAEDMPALATGSFSLSFGDFRQGYQIVDRLGVRTLRDPYTAKPYVVFYSIKRVGGGVIDFDAIKHLKFAA
ncbi:phage major capsid protein [Pleomorphomonas oryzae]|uniref:phage major capsid protein n=1 Tax=Pleomorphomonas oryzae TaxID=261934 RepID=UPI000428E1CA|nr:phage major capsid protein [Pleomorphomonas oryzae]